MASKFRPGQYICPIPPPGFMRGHWGWYGSDRAFRVVNTRPSLHNPTEWVIQLEVFDLCQDKHGYWLEPWNCMVWQSEADFEAIDPPRLRG